MRKSEEECAKQIAEYLHIRKIRDYTKLEVFKKFDLREGILDYDLFFKAIKLNKKLQSVSFGNILIADNPMISKGISECFEVNKSVTHLDLSICSLHEKNRFKLLKEIFEKTKTRKSLSLETSKLKYSFTDENVQLLIECLKSNNTVESLNIANNGISSENCALIFTEYLLTSKIKELDCRWNIDPTVENSMEILLNAVRLHKFSLHALSLDSKGYYYKKVISEKYFNDFGYVLKSFNELRKLSFNGNRLRSNSGLLVQFSEGFATCKNIQKLALSDCNLCAEAQNAFYLGEALKNLKELTWIDLSMNAIGKSINSEAFVMEALVNCE